MKPGPKKLYPCRVELTCSYEWRDMLDNWRTRNRQRFNDNGDVTYGPKPSRNEAIRTLVTQALENQ